MNAAIPEGATCPWPQRPLRVRVKTGNHRPPRVRVHSYIDGHVLQWVSEREARVLCAENSDGSPMHEEDGTRMEAKAKRLSRLKAPLADIKLLRPVRPEQPTACTLQMSDMVNNASGAVNPELRKPGTFSSGKVNPLKIGNYIDRAMVKVEAWPEAHDLKAPVIAAGVAYGSMCLWPQFHEDRFCLWPATEGRVVTFA